MKTLNLKTARCTMNAAGREAEIDIYGQIGRDWWGEGIDPLEFKNELDALGEIDLLKVRIHSYGGFVDEGQAIITCLRRHSAEKHIFVDGMAASMASVILQVGDRRYCASNGAVFIHDPVGICLGNLTDMERYATEMRQIRDQILDVYVEKSSLTRDEIAEMMQAETRMTAQEALDWGFIDEIGDEISTDPENHTSNYDNLFKIAASANFQKLAPHLALNSLSGNPESQQEDDPMDQTPGNSGNEPENQPAETAAASAEQLSQAEKQGASAERQRILDIQEMSQEGVEDLCQKCIDDGTSAGDAALVINKKLRELRNQTEQLDTRRNQANDPVLDDGAAPESAPAADDIDGQWENNVGNCRDTFLSKEAFAAFKRADSKGLVKELVRDPAS